MSKEERDRDRKWLERERDRWPDGWAARFVGKFGMEGALDLLAVQRGDPYGAYLARRPFCNSEPLKRAVREARDAVQKMMRLAYVTGWEQTQEESR